jgi:hypothetical protein
MNTMLMTAAAALAVATAFMPSPVPTTQATTGGIPELPLRLSAFAVNMSTAQRGKNTAVVDIRLKRWSTPAEREKLITTAVEKGQDALLRELQRMPDHGQISIPGWQGPDPHNARLGWRLHYAVASKGEDGGLRIAIATDRYIGMWEARESPRTIDYPFSLIDMRFDDSGKGVGKFAVATKIEFDKKKNQLVLENYASEPVRLNEIKIEK